MISPSNSKGNGFFSRDKPYFASFTSACANNGYEAISVGDKQSTYFPFKARSVEKYLNHFGFVFRFHDGKNGAKLNLFFQVIPETLDNKRFRDIILQNRNNFDDLQSVRTGGKHHIGIWKKEILFNPLKIEHKQLNPVVNEMFKTEVKDFTTKVIQALEKIHQQNT
jgi:hypothetical protein